MWLAWWIAACTRDRVDLDPTGETGTVEPVPTGATGSTAETGGPAPIPGPELLFDDAHRLVIPDGTGVHLVASDGGITLSRTWSELAGDCEECAGEGGSADGDGLLLSFTFGPFDFDGGIVRVNGDLGPDFRVDGFTFPHDAVRDPADAAIIIPESTANRITWVAGDGSSSTPVRTLGSGIEDWDGNVPNGIERFDHAGRSLLLSSHRGGNPFPTVFLPSGEITLWDITVPDAPELLWAYPQTGGLTLPHGSVFRWFDGRWWLIYAHSAGTPTGGGVGLAVTDDPTIPPEYVADLVPSDDIGPFVFLRGVELTTDGWLYLTDSGGRGGFPTEFPDGRLIRAAMPTLEPSGGDGSVGGDQVFRELEQAEVLLAGLANPFEGWLWAPPTP